MAEFCVTFGRTHSDPPGLLADKYLKVTALDELDARVKVHEKIGDRWAFIYPFDSAFEWQIAQYGLMEVHL
jgi:hypothetical protein